MSIQLRRNSIIHQQNNYEEYLFYSIWKGDISGIILSKLSLKDVPLNIIKGSTSPNIHKRFLLNITDTSFIV